MAWIDVPPAPGGPRAALAQAQARTAAAEAAPRWYSIRNAADPDEAELLLYDAIGGWFGIYADELIDELRGITAPNLRVRLNSPGGSVFEGIAIANALRAHPATVTVQVDGLAASIASVIAMAGDRVEMAPNSMLMIHEASGVCMGDAAEMEKMAEVLGMISANIANAYAARAGGDAATWRAAMQAETWYLPDDAVTAGLADVALAAVPTSPETEEEPEEDDLDEMMHARWDFAAYGYQGPPKASAPKPGPPPAKEPAAEPMTLTFNLGDAIGKDIAAALRAAITAPSVSVEPVAAGPAETPAAGPGLTPAAPAPVAPTNPDAPTAQAPEELPEWDEIVANLTASPADAWAAHLAHLTQPASSSATES